MAALGGKDLKGRHLIMIDDQAAFPDERGNNFRWR